MAKFTTALPHPEIPRPETPEQWDAPFPVGQFLRGVSAGTDTPAKRFSRSSLASTGQELHMLALKSQLVTTLELRTQGGGPADYLSYALVLLMPITTAGTTVGFAWASGKTTSFSNLSVLAFAMSCGVLLQFIALLFYGREAIKELCKMRYTMIVIQGALTAITYWTITLALTKINASVFTAISKQQSLFALLFYCLINKMMPTVDHTISIIVVVGIGMAFTILTEDVSGSGEMVVGVVLALIAALSAVLLNTSTEVTFRFNTNHNTGVPGEILRCMIWSNGSAVMLMIPLMLIFDFDIVKEGYFHGWTWQISIYVFFASFSPSLFSYCCLEFGSVLPPLVCSADLLIVYLLDVIATKSETFSTGSFILLLTLAAACVNYALRKAVANRAAREKTEEILRELDRRIVEMSRESKNKMAMYRP